MGKNEARSSETEIAILRADINALRAHIQRNSADIKEVEGDIVVMRDRQDAMTKRVDMFHGGVAWIYKSIFVFTALTGAFFTFFKGE